MERRTFLKTVGSLSALGSVTGCLGSGEFNDANPDVVLSEPERDFKSADVPYPAWGQRIPDVKLSAPLSDREMALREIETPSLLTFFYSHCQTICPVLIVTLRNIQAHAENHGYSSAVSFLPITFDPTRDTAGRLQAYGEKMNIATNRSNWEFLRPDSPARAKHVVRDQFGVFFERTNPEDMDQYMFTHAAVTILANSNGFVERAYRSQSPNEETILEDLRTVRTA